MTPASRPRHPRPETEGLTAAIRGTLGGMPASAEDDAGALAPPASGVLALMGLTFVEELHGGHQSRVVLARRADERWWSSSRTPTWSISASSRPERLSSEIWQRSTSTPSHRSKSVRR